jgi:hypothetical protein
MLAIRFACILRIPPVNATQAITVDVAYDAHGLKRIRYRAHVSYTTNTISACTVSCACMLVWHRHKRRRRKQ